MKVYCLDNRSLLENELTVGRGYWIEKEVHGRIYILNNFGHKDWYMKDRFASVIPGTSEDDDSDMKIYKGGNI